MFFETESNKKGYYVCGVGWCLCAWSVWSNCQWVSQLEDQSKMGKNLSLQKCGRNKVTWQFPNMMGPKGAQMSDRFRRVITLVPRLHKSLGTRLMSDRFRRVKQYYLSELLPIVCCAFNKKQICIQIWRVVDLLHPLCFIHVFDCHVGKQEIKIWTFVLCIQIHVCVCVAACHCTDSCTTRTTAQVAATWPTTSGMFFQVSNKTLNIVWRSLSKLITDVANVT